ncbi:hypothetical protein HAX54_026046 [Datura stramonium]|uniref:GIY-YIG domain-containing protein n=1 Tax=Datura stramonium TaxID=4076 RepID=A0ABS8V1T6_DATST|nr:hypothetical protein [Datura stramonium]
MPPKGTKKQQEATARKEIAKKQRLRDESDLRALVLPRRSEEGGEETEADDDDPPKDDEEEGKSAAKEESEEQESHSELATIPYAKYKIWILSGSRDTYYAGLKVNKKGNQTQHSRGAQNPNRCIE